MHIAQLCETVTVTLTPDGDGGWNIDIYAPRIRRSILTEALGVLAEALVGSPHTTVKSVEATKADVQ